MMKEVASLRYDVIFKKAFSQTPIFTAFVSDFLGLQLQEVAGHLLSLGHLTVEQIAAVTGFTVAEIKAFDDIP